MAPSSTLRIKKMAAKEYQQRANMVNAFTLPLNIFDFKQQILGSEDFCSGVCGLPRNAPKLQS
jgi:hypothetical protein